MMILAIISNIVIFTVVISVFEYQRRKVNSEEYKLLNHFVESQKYNHRRNK